MIRMQNRMRDSVSLRASEEGHGDQVDEYDDATEKAVGHYLKISVADHRTGGQPGGICQPENRSQTILFRTLKS